MNPASVLDWLEASWFSTSVRDMPWLFPLYETVHFFGLCILFGSILVVDLRLLGVGRRIPIDAFLPFIPASLAGFALSLISGIALFATDPFTYWPNLGFRLKMVLLVAGGLNALWFHLGERRRLSAIGPGNDPGLTGRISGALSLTIWVTVIILGRWLPYSPGATGG
jgi:hypothetical protein